MVFRMNNLMAAILHLFRISFKDNIFETIPNMIYAKFMRQDTAKDLSKYRMLHGSQKKKTKCLIKQNQIYIKHPCRPML